MKHSFFARDALIITLEVANFTVQRMLVNNGSSSNIIFWSALEAMGISRTKLEKSNSTLIVFDGKGLNGVIKLPVIVEGITQLISFLVIDSSPTYNLILGRP